MPATTGFGAQPLHDRTGKTLHDGDRAHGITTRAIRRKIHRELLDELELTAEQKALLRSLGESVFGTCPQCGRPETKLVLTGELEHCVGCSRVGRL